MSQNGLPYSSRQKYRFHVVVNLFDLNDTKGHVGHSGSLRLYCIKTIERQDFIPWHSAQHPFLCYIEGMHTWKHEDWWLNLTDFSKLCPNSGCLILAHVSMQTAEIQTNVVQFNKNTHDVLMHSHFNTISHSSIFYTTFFYKHFKCLN